MAYEGKNLETIALHAGWRNDENTGSVAVPIHVNASSQLDSPKDRLRNPFGKALPAQNPQSSSEQLLTANLAQQPSPQLANWQIG